MKIWVKRELKKADKTKTQGSHKYYSLFYWKPRSHQIDVLLFLKLEDFLRQGREKSFRLPYFGKFQMVGEFDLKGFSYPGMLFQSGILLYQLESLLSGQK